MGWADIITLLTILVAVLNSLLGQPLLGPDVIAVITFLIVALNGLIALLRYFFPENKVVQAARR